MGRRQLCPTRDARGGQQSPHAYHQTIDLTRRWGSGEIASADGLRFVVPVRSVHAGANPHYFGTGRGVTYYNWSSDQFTSWAAIVIPGTMRDSQFILDGLLDNTSVLQPREVMADTAADSYLIHGLFRLLGYKFSPRLADLPERRYWRLNPRGDYGAFNRVATHRIRRQLIEDNWPDICRVAGTLQTRTATASDVIRVLQRSGQPTTLGVPSPTWDASSRRSPCSPTCPTRRPVGVSWCS